MDTSSNQDFRVSDLECSEFTEDKEIAQKCADAVSLLLKKLKPILPYITIPVRVKSISEKECEKHPGSSPQDELRAVKLGPIWKAENSETLFLDKVGGFFTAKPCRNNSDIYHMESFNHFEWQRMLFGKLIEHLDSVLKEAEEKRKRHLQAITERREKLDNILKILKNK